MIHYTFNRYGSDIKVIEFNPMENLSQAVISPIRKRQPLRDFTHNYYTKTLGLKVIGAINLHYFNMDEAGLSLYNGMFARDSGFVDGVPNNGYEVWLNKDGVLNVEQLNMVGVKGIGNNWIWGASLAYSLILKGNIDIRSHSGFNLTGRTQRTAIGQRVDKTIVLMTGMALTGNESANVMWDLRCFNAIMGDGGGSTEMIVNGNQVFPSIRNKGTSLLIFGKENAQIVSPPSYITPPLPVLPPLLPMYRVIIDGKSIGAYRDVTNITKNVVAHTEKGVEEILIQKVKE